MRNLVRALSAVVLVSLSTSLWPATLPTPPFPQCPAVGSDSSCAVLLVIDENGSLRVVTDPTQGPYDRIEDTLVGVLNNSSNVVSSIPLKGASPIFGFDGDGICGLDPNTGKPYQPAPPGCPFGSTTYEGLGVSFSNISADATSGTVNFPGGLAPGGAAYFSLEGAPPLQCQPLAVLPLPQSGQPYSHDTYDHVYTEATDPSALFLPTGTLELVVYPQGTEQPDGGTSYSLTLTNGNNSLNGLVSAINALAVPGVTASVGRHTTSGGATIYDLAIPGASALQLRTTPGIASSNVFKDIGAQGCFLTSAAMTINYYAARFGGATTGPRELNNYLNNNNGYTVNGGVMPDVVAAFARTQKGVSMYYAGKLNGRNDYTLDSYLCGGNPVILKVSRSGHSHFVIATAQSTVQGQDTYDINDPAGGLRTNLLQTYNTYSGLRPFTTAFTPKHALYVILGSPAEVVVTDPNGLRAGRDPIAGTDYQQIPASAYSTDDLADDEDPAGLPTPAEKVVEIRTPASGNYLVDVIGTGDGPYTLEVDGFDVAAQHTRATTAGTVSSGARFRYQVFYSSTPGAAVQITQVAIPDTVPPVTVASPTPAANANGWNNSDVTITFSSTDNESGGTGVREIDVSLSGAQTGSTVIAGASGTVTVTAEGTTTVTYYGVDNAGNVETPKTQTVKIDKTPPSIIGMPAAGCTLWPPDHKLVQVATVTAADSLSGLVSFNVGATSNEPADADGPDVVITGGALQPQAVQLRAERLGAGSGRTYTVTATAVDLAGNATVVKGTCTVPHDQGH